MKLISVLFCLLLTSSCYVEEQYTLSERLTGKWAFSGRTAFFNNGSFSRNLPLDVCEYNTEFIFSKDGTLKYKDYREKEINDGTIDICEENLITSEEGVWDILSTDKLRIILKSNEDGSDIIIKPYEVTFSNEDQLNILNIRYKEFEENAEDSVSYFVYHYFRIYN